MARLARIVIPNIPHLITQTGNRGQDVFFGEDDALSYIDTMAAQCARFGVDIWAYCLLRNRVHFLAVPEDENGLARTLGETHRRYTNRINERKGWTGHLWQSRFSSFPLEERYVLPAAQFIEMTPVMAGLAKDPAAFKWSSAKAHLRGQDDTLCQTTPLLLRVSDWDIFLQNPVNLGDMDKITSHIKTGRPLGSAEFIETLETQTGRSLKKKKPGRKPKTAIKTAPKAANDKRQRLLVPERQSTTKITEQDLAALIEGSSQ